MVKSQQHKALSVVRNPTSERSNIRQTNGLSTFAPLLVENYITNFANLLSNFSDIATLNSILQIDNG
jgi:Holliday junction resolvase RusA-like endonuclease